MKNSVKLMILIVLFVLVISMVGCQFEPKDENDSLIIGKMDLMMVGFDSSEKLLRQRVNGRHTGAINITFSNEDTGKNYYVMTDRQGFFHIYNPQPGTYNITKMQFKVDAGFGWTQITDSSERLLHIKVEPAKVVNLGNMIWIAVSVDDRHFNSRLQLDPNPEQLKELFEQKFPDSLWLERTWVNFIFED